MAVLFQKRIFAGAFLPLTCVSVPATVLGATTAPLVPASQVPAEKPVWSGTVGLGLSSSTGTNQELNLNSEDSLLWHRGVWSNQSHLLYNYSNTQGEASSDRLDISNQTRYDFTPKQYIFANLSYDRNHSNGYFFRADQTIGYGRYLSLTRESLLTLEGGVGVRQSHPIGGIYSIQPIARIYGKYRWTFSRNAHLSEAVDAIVANNDANTYSSKLSVTTPLYGALNLRVTFIATYNTKVQAGYLPMNTLTIVTMNYNF